ncbi:uncharacterized protein DSM5745_03507 [Aspergillus mulundensis]|uniref:FAD/NAD(P)-binding domain-containing protein n=1 Tax=Aspergillus mulundensis TaxID=1810919 RepID=A0A3D8SKK3_9EURO|nr:Uncharacterized protein DSM5745_03507 [Aspergillus mulundensis]RDW86865.1 Uncharacterized protein DSM5745_03507 [Aspergillus mulundensis]
MAPRYPTVAIIGTGPAGISALKALHDEKAFDKIRVFERRDSPGGTWNYDAIPQRFPGTYPSADSLVQKPSTFPQTTSPALPTDETMPTAIYSWLDTNVPAELMAFTHTPFLEGNSPISVERYGERNVTRPWHVVAQYLLNLVEGYRGSISFKTTVVSVDKMETGKWRLTLRRSEVVKGEARDFWWQEEFDAVIVAVGQYNEPFLPSISGLEESVKTHPGALEHVSAFRSRSDYVGRRVVVLGGSFSASDAVGDIYTLVQQPLYVSQSSHSPHITEIWNLPNVVVKPTISHIEGQDNSKLKLTFLDGSQLEDVDKVIFATGYRFSFPFLSPEPLVKAHRVPRTYQHVFRVGDPSLAFLGLVRAPLLFRMMEYEAVAAARYYAGHGGELPGREDQERWEVEQVKLKGETYKFHDVTGEMKEHMEFLRDLAGPPAPGTDAYELPQVADEWLEKAFSGFRLKNDYWGRVRRAAESQR